MLMNIRYKSATCKNCNIKVYLFQTMFTRFLQVKDLIQTRDASQVRGGCGLVLDLEVPLTTRES